MSAVRRDRLHGCDLGVLAGDDGIRLGGGAVPVRLQGRDDADGDAVVRGEHGIDLGGGIGAGQQVVHALLGGPAVPAQGGDLVELRLLAADDQLLLVDVGLEGLPGALEEVARVVVVRGPGEQLDVERALLGAGLQPELVEDVAGLELADLLVVERGVVVDVRSAEDEPVVRDDLDALLPRLVQYVAECAAVDGGDDEDVHALGDHVLDLGDLLVDVVLAVLQIRLVAELLELGGHVLAVGYPAFGRFGRHGDSDGGALAARLLLLAAAVPALSAGGEGDGEGEGGENRDGPGGARDGRGGWGAHVGPPGAREAAGRAARPLIRCSVFRTWFGSLGNWRAPSRPPSAISLDRNGDCHEVFDISSFVRNSGVTVVRGRDRCQWFAQVQSPRTRPGGDFRPPSPGSPDRREPPGRRMLLRRWGATRHDPGLWPAGRAPMVEVQAVPSRRPPDARFVPPGTHPNERR